MLTVLTVGVVNGVVVGVVAVETDAVVSVVTTGVLTVDADSVMNGIGTVVLSTKHNSCYPHAYLYFKTISFVSAVVYPTFIS